MELIVVEDYEAMSQMAADHVAAFIRAKPDANVVLPTGATPVGLFRELAARWQRGELDTSRLRVFQLDAYLGESPDDPGSLYGAMVRSFLDPLQIRPDQVVRLPGDTDDPIATGEAYANAVRGAGGLDLAVLGLGPNGHLGFNEPPASATSPTRVVELTEESIVANATYWGGVDKVPRRALTAGMDLLLVAGQTILLVSGEHKRDILRRALVGPITPEVPASYLQRVPFVTVIADRAAWPEPNTFPAPVS
jgi:glucosamine-6-phosphate deaminase